ncbi:MAG: COX15/CtaA family protein [Gammaproteobacteria bacterium]|nr:COX15/CtaA family protein [Gammaproteobacteria bacterium]
MFRSMTIAALVLAYGVVVLGAYTRLSDAGLGCPDWPGCYGKIVVPEADQAADANAIYPERPLHTGKAWKEMIHRYAAGALGLLILGLALLGWRNRRLPDRPLLLPLLLLGLVLFQAALGMWTVTWLLKPIVVAAHLLGGFAVLSLLFWLLLDQTGFEPARLPGRLAAWGAAGIAVLILQIFLGGWTSANYAALVCPEFPACRGGAWWPETDFAEAFTFWRGIGTNYEYGVLDPAARTAIHLAHRLGALVAAVVIAVVALRAIRSADRTVVCIGIAILCLLGAQLALGIGNVLLVLPLAVAVAHNGTAALLLLALVALLHRASRSRSRGLAV